MKNHLARTGVVLLSWLIGSSMAIAQTSPTAGYHLYTIGLTGSGYEYSSGGGTVRFSIGQNLTSAGQAIGLSVRYNTSQDYLGQDSWIWNGSSTQQIGLTGGSYQYTYVGAGTGTYRSSQATGVNTAGQASGYSFRFNTSGNDLGQDAWLWTGSANQMLGFTGAGYEHTSLAPGGGTYRVSSADSINAAGQVIGYSNRYNSSGVSFGQDAWLWTGSATQLIGLTGTGYQYSGTGGQIVRNVSAKFLNAAGQVAGHSVRYNTSGNNYGQDAWIWTGSATQQIGLVGSGYEVTVAGATGGTFRNNDVTALTSAGKAIGYSFRYNASENALGQDAWIWTGSATQQIGLVGTGYEYTYAGTGGGTFRSSVAEFVSAAGQVTGSSTRYNASSSYIGQDAFAWNGSASTQIGFTGTNYQYTYTGTGGGTYRYSDTAGINATGQSIGYSSRYNSAGTDLGQDAWLYTGASTSQIGLTGTNYQFTSSGTGGGTYRFSAPDHINAAGQATGFSLRFSAAGADLGQAAWFYDPTSAVTTALIFSSRSSDGYANSSAHVLTDNGVVLGSYELYLGTADQGSRAFYWSTAAGFYDLGALAQGTLTADGWQSLANVAFANGPAGLGFFNGSPQFILGTGLTTGQSDGSTTYLLAVVPEPSTAVILLLVATGGVLRRSNRKTNDILFS